MAKEQHKFVSTDTEEIVSELTAGYEQTTGSTVRPASPENLLVRWAANFNVQERVNINYAANQNIPSRSNDANLDALAELFYLKERPGAKSAVCTVRFYLSEARGTATLIPSGTRVTDTQGVLVWATVTDAYVPAGSISLDVSVYCQTAGAIGNGYAPGQINTLVDIFPFYSRCENITESGGGSDPATDAEFYSLLRESEDAYSTAGAVGSYVYHAKSVSTEIADVVPNSPLPGYVNIYALMDDGTPANEETKAAILEACNDDTKRPLTDFVHVQDPEIVSYDIDFTFYILRSTVKSAAEIERDVQLAVERYVAWQSARLGRDVNPDELIHLLKTAGVKRAEIVAPAFTPLRDGRKFELGNEPDSVPQLAVVGTMQIRNGGYEDD